MPLFVLIISETQADEKYDLPYNDMTCFETAQPSGSRK
jgi:hypothetical protein